MRRSNANLNILVSRRLGARLTTRLLSRLVPSFHGPSAVDDSVRMRQAQMRCLPKASVNLIRAKREIKIERERKDSRRWCRSRHSRNTRRSADRAPPFEGGYSFESCRARHFTPEHAAITAGRPKRDAMLRGKDMCAGVVLRRPARFCMDEREGQPGFSTSH